MNRIVASLIFVLSTASAWAQAGGAASAQGSSSALGWTIAAIGALMVVVVAARRFSTGQPFKQEMPVAIVGILVLNIGIWLVVSTKISDIEKRNQALQNQVTVANRRADEAQANSDALRGQVGQWQQRDQEYRKVVDDWKTYATALQAQLAAATKPPTPKAGANKAPAEGKGAKPAAPATKGTPKSKAKPGAHKAVKAVDAAKAAA